MHRRTLAALALPALALLTCCSTTTTGGAVVVQPTWVSAPSSADTPGRLTGVGSGATRQEAEDDAFAALAERLLARVQSESIVVREDEQTGQGADLRARSRFLAESVARVSSDLRVSGARIDQIVHEAEAGRFFALASLDVALAHDWHQAEGEAALGAAREASQRASQADSPLQASQALGTARRAADRAVDNFAVALALNPADEASREGLSSSVSVRLQVAHALAQALVVVQVTVASPRSAPERVTLAVSEGVEAVGARLARPGDAGAHLRLLVDLVVEDLESFDARQALRRWALTLEARAGDGSLLTRRMYEGVTTAPTSARAEALAVEEASAKARVEGEALARAIILGAQ